MKYLVVLLTPFKEDRVLYYDNWLLAKLKMMWLNITGHSAVWLEKRSK